MNRVVHFEIHASDQERLKKFYADVFGWEMQQMGSDFGNYVVVQTGPSMPSAKIEEAGINGGMMKRNAPKPSEGTGPNAYVCIIGVDDVDAYMAKVKAAGGIIAMDKMVVPGVGDLAYCKDPDGNLFGIIKPVMRAQS